jgi:ADP-dependent NAD(P)H-hydrate dehydratase / NAD(P)H-hydrate epimerase
MKVLTAQQMRDVDRLTTERYGISGQELMENAGVAVVEFLRDKFTGLTRRKIVILCGKGNNGGDGLVVARLLKELGCSPEVIAFFTPSVTAESASVNLQRWQQESGSLRIVTNAAEWEVARAVLDETNIIVDALLGTGLRGAVEGILADVIDSVNAVRARNRPTKRVSVVAVDIPSGLASDGQDFPGSAILADFTVTFTAPKIGQLVSARAANCGELVVRNIGTPPELFEADPQLKIRWLEPGEFRVLPLARDPAANKGTYGHALMVAGSLGKSGAALLASRGALRSGAGLVTSATPQAVLPIVAAGMPELMTVPLADTDSGTASLRNLDYGRFTEIARGKTVLAIGPGLSTNNETQQFIRTVVAETDLPIILDADGLNAFAGAAEKMTERRAAFLAVTPHPGEMARLVGGSVKDVQARRLELALEMAARWRAHVILKGFRTILATPAGDAYVNTTGNPGMATGGTGDVLTGILAGLTAQLGTKHWPQVLGFGIYLHGMAGDIAASRVGQAPLIASDLLDAIPEAYGQLLSEWHYGE